MTLFISRWPQCIEWQANSFGAVVDINLYRIFAIFVPFQSAWNALWNDAKIIKFQYILISIAASKVLVCHSMPCGHLDYNHFVYLSKSEFNELQLKWYLCNDLACTCCNRGSINKALIAATSNIKLCFNNLTNTEIWKQQIWIKRHFSDLLNINDWESLDFWWWFWNKRFSKTLLKNISWIDMWC